MLKNLARLEHTVEGRVFHFLCDQDSPLPAVKEALFKFMGYIGQIEDQVKAQQEAAAKAEAEKNADATVEESKVEPIPTEQQG